MACQESSYSIYVTGYSWTHCLRLSLFFLLLLHPHLWSHTCLQHSTSLTSDNKYLCFFWLTIIVIPCANFFLFCFGVLCFAVFFFKSLICFYLPHVIGHTFFSIYFVKITGAIIVSVANIIHLSESLTLFTIAYMYASSCLVQKKNNSDKGQELQLIFTS